MNSGAGRKKQYSFRLEVMVEGYNEAMAKENLLGLLKSNIILSFQLEGDSVSTNPVYPQTKKTKPKLPPVDPTETANPINIDPNDLYVSIIKQIEHFKNQNTLIRLSIVKGKGITLSVPCRVLNFDEETQNVTIYHVDEKKVYQYNLNEIDELSS